MCFCCLVGLGLAVRCWQWCHLLSGLADNLSSVLFNYCMLQVIPIKFKIAIIICSQLFCSVKSNVLHNLKKSHFPSTLCVTYQVQLDVNRPEPMDYKPFMVIEFSMMFVSSTSHHYVVVSNPFANNSLSDQQIWML